MKSLMCFVLMLQLGEMPDGEKSCLLDQLDTAERQAMEERLETSYRQIREYQDTLCQSQEQMDGARAFIESSEVRWTSHSELDKGFYGVRFKVNHSAIMEISIKQDKRSL